MPKDYTPSQECMNQVPWILAHTRVETTGDLQRQKAKSVPLNPPGIWCLFSCGKGRNSLALLECSYTTPCNIVWYLIIKQALGPRFWCRCNATFHCHGVHYFWRRPLRLCFRSPRPLSAVQSDVLRTYLVEFSVQRHRRFSEI
jgi:hypothetical protein